MEKKEEEEKENVEEEVAEVEEEVKEGIVIQCIVYSV